MGPELITHTVSLAFFPNNSYQNQVQLAFVECIRGATGHSLSSTTLSALGLFSLAMGFSFMYFVSLRDGGTNLSLVDAEDANHE